MQHLSAAELGKLEQQSRSFTIKHVRFISDALNVVQQGGDALDALALLSKMQGSTYAGREQEADALHDVGRWLATYLRDERRYVQSGELALRLAWLRRLAHIAEKDARTSGQRDAESRGGRPARANARPAARKLEDDLQELRKRYEGYAAQGVASSAPPAPIDSSAVAAENEARRQQEITALIKKLKPGDTDGTLSAIFKLVMPSELGAVARRCEDQLSRKTVRNAIKENKPWVRQLARYLNQGDRSQARDP